MQEINQNENVTMPVSEKYMLTIREASVYFNIGVKKMRRLAEDNTGRFAVLQKDVLNPEEAIEYFGFSRRKFNRFLKDGICKKYTALYGKRRLILRSEFEKYLEENPEVKEGLLNGGKSKVTA